MILNEGDKLLVAYRRLYREDGPRYLIGVVQGFGDGLAMVRGRLYSRDMSSGKVIVQDVRTEIIPVSSGTLVINLLPADTKIDAVRMYRDGVRLLITDDAQFQMDLTDSSRGSG